MFNSTWKKKILCLFPGGRLRRIALIFAAGLGLLPACVEEAEFTAGAPPSLLVVDGRITTNQGPQTLRLFQVAAYGQRRGDPVSGASATLLDDRGSRWSYRESTEEPGLYELPDVRGQIGRSYQLEIHRPDGRIYRSEPERLPPAPKIDSLTYNTTFESTQDESGAVQEKWFINAFVHTTLAPQEEGPYLRWEVETVFSFPEIGRPNIIRPPNICYIYELLDPQDIRLFDGSGVAGSQTIERQIGRRHINWVFQDRHYFNAYQSSLTERAFAYWSDINLIANQAGTVFDPPAGAIRGNVYNSADPKEPVLGYFGASAIDTARFFTTRPDLPGIPIIPYCGTTTERPSPLPGVCTYCITLPNSSYVRPDYF